jgi:hypothetical protein
MLLEILKHKNKTVINSGSYFHKFQKINSCKALGSTFFCLDEIGLALEDGGRTSPPEKK